MLQLAHEAVAQGVEDHSDFKGNPFKRLLGTLEAMYAMVLGSEELAAGVGRRIQWIHDFIVGPTYQANDPANLLWVHATLADTALALLRAVRRAADRRRARDLLPGDDRDRGGLRLPARGTSPPPTPTSGPTWTTSWPTIDVTAGRQGAGRVHPRPVLPLGLHVPLAPLLRQQRRTTLGSLPPRLRGAARRAVDRP